jgi:hypothetical protein
MLGWYSTELFSLVQDLSSEYIRNTQFHGLLKHCTAGLSPKYVPSAYQYLMERQCLCMLFAMIKGDGRVNTIMYLFFFFFNTCIQGVKRR